MIMIEGIAIGAGGLEFNFQAYQIGQSSYAAPTAMLLVVVVVVSFISAPSK